MNKVWWVPLALALAMGCNVVSAHPQANSKEFVLALPPELAAARSVVLVLSDVRLPRSAAVVLRARLAEGEAELPLGSTGVLAESKDAQGTATHTALRIDITKPLLRWRQEHPYASEVRIRVVPFAGKEALPDLEWSAASASLTLGSR